MKKNKISLSIKENLNLHIPKFYELRTLSKIIIIYHLITFWGFIIKYEASASIWSEIDSKIWFFEGFLIIAISVFTLMSVLIEKINRNFKNDLVLFFVFSSAIFSAYLTTVIYKYLNIFEVTNLLHYSLVSVCYTILYLIYFDWEHKRLSPALSEAKLQALQSRIRPHFIFNSINSIIYVLSKNPTKAENLLLDLADLFRFTFQEATSLVELSKEIEIVKKYLNIEMIRLGSRLNVNFNYDSEIINKYYIPRLILQPIVENAVIHGIETNNDIGSINIKTYVVNNMLEISVQNTKKNIKKTNLRKTNGIAVENIKSRLSLFFESKYTYEISNTEKYYSVIIRIPLINKELASKYDTIK